MRLTSLMPSGTASRPAWTGRPSVAGFSLLEVIIAGALLLVTVTGATACVTAVSRAGRQAEGGMAADRALAAVAGRLGSLPFCPSELPAPAAARGAGAADLVSAVFPHADAGGGSEDGRFIEVGEDGLPAGSFVTSLSFDGVTVVCVARFRPAGGGWLGPGDLVGYDVSTAAGVPAAVLELDLRAATAGRPRSYRFESRAGATTMLDPEASRS